MGWFVQYNYFKTKEYLPKVYKIFGQCLGKTLCLIFHSCKKHKIKERISRKDKSANSSNICIYCEKKLNLNGSSIETKRIINSNIELINHFIFILMIFLLLSTQFLVWLI